MRGREGLAKQIEVVGIESKECQDAVEYALEAIQYRFPGSAESMLRGVTIEIGEGLTESGGETRGKRILLDAVKNAQPLQVTEDYLVTEGYLDTGDWTSVLADIKDKPWSTLTYNLVHEVGHVLGGHLQPELSPTKYGRTSSSGNDAFPEAFAYYVFGKPQDSASEKHIMENWGEL